MQCSILRVRIYRSRYYLILGLRDLCRKRCEELSKLAGFVGACEVENLVHRVFVDVGHVGQKHVLDLWVYGGVARRGRRVLQSQGDVRLCRRAQLFSLAALQVHAGYVTR